MTKDDFITISVPADGNCLIHSILRASYKDYIYNEDENYRRKLTKHFRSLMSDYILQTDTDYPSKESIVQLVMKTFDVLKPRKFMEFLEAMYNYTNKELSYPREPTDEMGLNEYTELIKYENSIYFEDAKELYNHIEKNISSKIVQFRNMLEEKMGDTLYLPTTFNEKVIEAVLENKEIPKGLYNNLQFNCRLFTYSSGANMIKISYEYNKLEDMLYLRDVPEFFKSNQFIGDADVLSYIPDIMNINIIIVDIKNNTVINIYETEKSENYVIINNIENVHFEPIVLKMENKNYTLFEREDEFIQDIIKSRKLY
jgi:hypothetical protein